MAVVTVLAPVVRVRLGGALGPLGDDGSRVLGHDLGDDVATLFRLVLVAADEALNLDLRSRGRGDQRRGGLGRGRSHVGRRGGDGDAGRVGRGPGRGRSDLGGDLDRRGRTILAAEVERGVLGGLGAVGGLVVVPEVVDSVAKQGQRTAVDRGVGVKVEATGVEGAGVTLAVDVGDIVPEVRLAGRAVGVLVLGDGALARVGGGKLDRDTTVVGAAIANHVVLLGPLATLARDNLGAELATLGVGSPDIDVLVAVVDDNGVAGGHDGREGGQQGGGDGDRLHD